MSRSKKLSEEQREEILKNYTREPGQIDALAQKYGVSKSTIIRIIRPNVAEAERQQRRKYMAETYEYPQRYIVRLNIDPEREPDIYHKLSEVEKNGRVGARQHYIKQLIKKDIQKG